MAKPKNKRDRSNWIRSGGYYGDESMDEQKEYNDSGAEVSCDIVDYPESGDPNKDVKLLNKNIPGAE